MCMGNRAIALCGVLTTIGKAELELISFLERFKYLASRSCRAFRSCLRIVGLYRMDVLRYRAGFRVLQMGCVYITNSGRSDCERGNGMEFS